MDLIPKVLLHLLGTLREPLLVTEGLRVSVPLQELGDLYYLKYKQYDELVNVILNFSKNMFIILKSSVFFSRGPHKVEEACEMYCRAANMFKMAKNWSGISKETIAPH